MTGLLRHRLAWGIIMHRHLLLIASAALLASCGEQKSTAPTTTQPPAEATTSSPPAPPAAAAAGGEIPDAQARLTLVTLAAPYNAADLANRRDPIAYIATQTQAPPAT